MPTGQTRTYATFKQAHEAALRCREETVVLKKWGRWYVYKQTLYERILTGEYRRRPGAGGVGTPGDYRPPLWALGKEPEAKPGQPRRRRPWDPAAWRVAGAGRRGIHKQYRESLWKKTLTRTAGAGNSFRIWTAGSAGSASTAGCSKSSSCARTRTRGTGIAGRRTVPPSPPTGRRASASIPSSSGWTRARATWSRPTSSATACFRRSIPSSPAWPAAPTSRRRSGSRRRNTSPRPSRASR